MATAGHARYTYAQYVAVEEHSDIKHEFLDGAIYAMAGGSEDHSTLSVNAIVALNSLVGADCKVHSSDLRVYVEALGMATYPDASVVCSELVQHAASPKSTALNPSILVEVTSPWSAEYDRTTKLEAYQTIATLREYIIISHDERRITVHSRSAGGWKTRVAITGGRLEIESLAAELVVDDLYRKTSI
jgi:Uma2 family endonuclease